jgi:uncharacterized alpha-E superfamily protein
MLSRVADSVYWMSRYLERAAICARAIEAAHTLMLTRATVSVGQPWYAALTALGMPPKTDEDDEPHELIARLATDPGNRASIVACIAGARENASQVREEISSEMWEHLNRLYHDVSSSNVPLWDDVGVMRLVSAVRSGSYTFHGITGATMSHGEGWGFAQLGQFTERAAAVSLLLDSYCSAASVADELDWTALLTSCSAFESYCRTFGAELKPDRIVKFLLVHPDFPYSVRYSVERMHVSLESIAARSPSRHRSQVERVVGRLRASLAFTPMSELMEGDLHRFLNGVIEQCRELHASVHDAYIDYAIEIAFES